MKKLLFKLKTVATNWQFYVGFIITWIILESPAIVGAILGFITGNNEWWVLVTSWIALTAPPLPIPVIPASIGVGIWVSTWGRHKQ